MFCKYCGSEIPDGSIFCENCGRKLINEDKSVHVTSGAEVSSFHMANTRISVLSDQLKTLVPKLKLYCKKHIRLLVVAGLILLFLLINIHSSAAFSDEYFGKGIRFGISEQRYSHIKDKFGFTLESVQVMDPTKPLDPDYVAPRGLPFYDQKIPKRFISRELVEYINNINYFFPDNTLNKVEISLTDRVTSIAQACSLFDIPYDQSKDDGSGTYRTTLKGDVLVTVSVDASKKDGWHRSILYELPYAPTFTKRLIHSLKPSRAGKTEPAVSASENVASSVNYSDLRIGTYIDFGRYEQDGDYENGYEPIEWEVLYIDGNRALLLSRYVLDQVCYNEENVDTTWEVCTLREWLNNDFLNTAFTASEQSYIQNSYIINDDNPYELSAMTHKPLVEGGNDTQDRVFCLSVDEIFEYCSYYFYRNNNRHGSSLDLLASPTQYAEDQGVGASTFEKGHNLYNDNGIEDYIGNTYAKWWLRSRREKRYYCIVDSMGGIGWEKGEFITDDTVGVRPAMWITIE